MEARHFPLKNESVLLVRGAQRRDARALVEYLDDISRESDFLAFGPGEHGADEARQQAFIREHLERENCLFALGLIDDRIVASLSFTGGPRPRTRHAGEFGLSVRQEYWGLGIGSSMLDALIEWAGDNTVVTKINLRVREDNERAIRLYKRKGFTLEGTIRRDIFVGGRYFDHYWMGLDV